MITMRLEVPTKKTIKEVLKDLAIISKFLMSTIGPIRRKAITGASPKLESKEAPIKASASLQRDKIKAISMRIKIPKTGLVLIEVKIRVGR